MKEPVQQTLKSRLSVVVPVLNEEDNLRQLVARVDQTLTDHGWQYELIIVLDGCTDGSLALLKQLQQTAPSLRILELAASIGQHAAIAEGMKVARFDLIATLDADLQNPPESLPDIAERLAAGSDAVGTIRQNRQDAPHRALASTLFATTLRLLGVRHIMADPGCMLRGWRRSVVDAFLASGHAPLYLPTQLNRYALTYEEFVAPHSARSAGESRYNARRLARLFARTLVAEVAPGRVRGPKVDVVGRYDGDE